MFLSLHCTFCFPQIFIWTLDLKRFACTPQRSFWSASECNIWCVKWWCSWNHTKSHRIRTKIWHHKHYSRNNWCISRSYWNWCLSNTQKCSRVRNKFMKYFNRFQTPTISCLLQHTNGIHSSCCGKFISLDSNFSSNWMVLLFPMVGFVLSSNLYEFPAKKCCRSKFWLCFSQYCRICAVFYVQYWLVFYAICSGFYIFHEKWSEYCSSHEKQYKSVVFFSLFKDEYFQRFPRGLIPVQLNDVFFATHATMATLIIISQCLTYEVS